jgi:hypothetical protein
VIFQTTVWNYSKGDGIDLKWSGHRLYWIRVL